MPSLETRDLKQRAVCWVGSGNYDRYGQPMVSSTAVELRVRWLNKYRQVLLPNGDTIAYDVQVITNQFIPVGSVMWQGTIASIPGTGFVPSGNFYEVKTSNQSPDIKNRAQRYELELMRLRNTLPNFSS